MVLESGTTPKVLESCGIGTVPSLTTLKVCYDDPSAQKFRWHGSPTSFWVAVELGELVVHV